MDDFAIVCIYKAMMQIVLNFTAFIDLMNYYLTNIDSNIFY